MEMWFAARWCRHWPLVVQYWRRALGAPAPIGASSNSPRRARCAIGRCPAPRIRARHVAGDGSRAAFRGLERRRGRRALGAQQAGEPRLFASSQPGRAGAPLGARSRRGHLAGPTPLAGRVALGGSIGTSDDGIEAPGSRSRFAGCAQRAARATGRRQDRLHQSAHGAHARRRGLRRTVRNRSEGPSAAGQLGALALLIRSVGTSDERHRAHRLVELSRRCAAHSGARAVESRRRPAGARLKPGKPVRLRVKSTARELPAAWSANVIGEIPGTSAPTRSCCSARISTRGTSARARSTMARASRSSSKRRD